MCSYIVLMPLFVYYFFFFKIRGVALAYPVIGAKGKSNVLSYIFIPFDCEEVLQVWSRSVA